MSQEIYSSHLYFLLGQRKSFDTDGERMLKLILARYDIWNEFYSIEYCYNETPPSKAAERQHIRDEARRWCEACWHDMPGVFVGLGWMACEVLTGRGKTKLKDTAGTKWKYAGSGMDQAVWITYDPAAMLFDPGVAVDISAVVCAAGREIGLKMDVTEEHDSLSSMHRIWRRYL